MKERFTSLLLALMKNDQLSESVDSILLHFKKISLPVILLVCTVLGAGNLTAQSPVYFSSGDYTNPNNWAQGSASLMSTVVGTNIHTATPNGTGDKYFRFYSANAGGTTYEPNGASDILLTSSTSSALEVAGSGKAYYLTIANASSNVVFKTTGGGTPGTSAVVAFEVQGPISSVNTVAQSYVNSRVAAGQPAVITANLNTGLSTGQAVYIRYTRDGYATSTVVQMTGAGTVYTATIPGAFNTLAQPNISYYVFTSGISNVAANGSNADFFTINLNNNGGGNYSYTVLSALVNVASTLLPANDAVYPTVQDAFSQINLGIHQGIITVSILGNTTETGSAVLNASGVGAASYTSVSIQPSGGAARTVSGNIAGPLIDLNGADNVTINGLNTGGNSLTISNTSTSNTAGTSTIRMYGAAITNTVQNCTIEGSTTSSSDGVISFGSGNNSGNIINLNTIKPAGTNLPTYGILSSGASTGVSVTTNIIQDYFAAAASSAGINLNSTPSAWTITGNKFFQTATRTATASTFTHRGIYISSGGGYTISTNVIGYANSASTGTTTYTGAFATRFCGIELAGNATSSSIQGNIVGGISLTSTSAPTTASGLFTGIYVSSGNANIGTSTPNTIGATTGTGSITINSSTTGTQTFVAGIACASTNAVTIQNNNIGSITLVSASGAVQFNFYGIYTSASGNFTISGNVIGSTTTANSIQIGTGSTNATNFTGIGNTATGTISVTGNTIQNCSTSGTGSAAFTAISASGGTGTLNITSNNIISGTNAGTGFFMGILVSGAALPATLNITTNIIRSNSITSATGGFYAINNSVAVTTAINIDNNQLGNASGGLLTYSIANSGSMNGIYNGAGAAAATLSIQTNDIRGVTHTATGSSAHSYITNAAAVTTQNISSNTFTSLSVATSGNIIFIANSVVLPAGGTQTINSNSVSGTFAKTVAGGTVTFFTTAANSAAGATINQNSNNFSNISVTGATTIAGWSNQDAGGTLRTIQGNVFNNITGGSNAVTIMNIGGGSSSVNTNTITSVTGAGAVTAIAMTAGTSDVFSNTINTLTTSVASGSSVNGIVISGGTAIAVYRNKIYDLNASGAGANLFVNGISITAGTGATVYNNIIGDLKSPASTVASGINGINISSTTASATYNVYYNSIYLNATGGAGGGSSGIYHAGNGTSTVAALNLRNNLIINMSTPGSGGFTVAFRRTNTNLANYASTSNNNLFYAGVPAANRLIYYDGTNSQQTINGYKAMTTPATLSPRDAAAVSGLPTFLSLTASNANFLHLDPAVASVAESGAADPGSMGNDYDGDTRFGYPGYSGTGTAPDIGADEANTVSCGTPPNLINFTPATGPYYAGDVITVNGTGLGAVTLATINGVSATIVGGSVTATSVQLIIPGGIATASGNILVGNSVACGYSNGLPFVFGGYITKGGGTGSGNWNTATIWQGNAVPVANSIVVINNGDAVTLDVSADPSSLTINATATLTHANNSYTLGTTNLTTTNISGTLNIDATTPVFSSTNRFKSTTVTVLGGGIFNNNSGIATAVSITNFNINANGLYVHNAVGTGTSPSNGAATDFPGTTRTFDAASTVEFKKWANNGTSPAALANITWGNLKINVASLAGDWDNLGNVCTIKGNLDVLQSGGGARLFITASTSNYATSPTIDGNVTVTGGTLMFSHSINYSMTIGGNVTVNNATLIFARNSGRPTINLVGSIFAQASSIISIGGSGIGNYIIGGDFSITGGSITAPSNTVTMAINGTAVGTTGSFLMTAGSYLPASSSSSILNLTVEGDMILSGGTMTMINGSTAGPLFTANIKGTTAGTTGKLELSGNAILTNPFSSGLVITTKGDFITSGTSQFIAAGASSGSRNQILNIGGNMNLGAGTTFSAINTGSSQSVIRFIGGSASASFTNNAATFNIIGIDSVVVDEGKTLVMNSDFALQYTLSVNPFFIVRGTLDLCSDKIISGPGTFILYPTVANPTVRGTLKIGNQAGITAAIATLTGSVRTTIARTFPTDANYEYCGSVAQVTGTGLTGARNLVINNAAGVTLNAVSITVSNALQFNSGKLALDIYNLTMGAPGLISGVNTSRYVVTNSTGELRIPVPTTGLPLQIDFPVGSATNYTPASYTFTANSTARNLHVRAVTPRNSNDVSANNYINNRWWNTDLSVTTGTYTYTGSYTYITGDIVGSAAAIRLNKWNGSAWVEDAGSSVNTGTNTLNSGTLTEATGALNTTAQWVGRSYTPPAIYHWTNTVPGSWLDATKWTPTGVPGSGDGVVFDATGGAPYVVNSMPTGISLTQFTVSNNNAFTLQAGATAGAVNMIYPGTAAPQFSIAAGSAMTMEGTTPVNFNLPVSATGSVAGSLNLQKAAHSVTAVTAGALVFSSGSYFSYGHATNTGFTGYPFGGTGTNGSVIFQNGSVCEHFEGGNPFGDPAMAGVNIITFQTGSLYKYSAPSGLGLSTSGRTYANFEYNSNFALTATAAASSFICDNLTGTLGTLVLRLQGTPGHAIRGNITIAAGANITLSPAAAGTVNMNSGGTQIISGAGTFDVNAATTLNIASGTTVSLQKNMGVNSASFITINGTLICTGENNVNTSAATGTVTLNNGGTLSIQSADGISSTGVGNIRSTTFTYNTGGNFIYSGSANQVTGNRLPATLTGASILTIANTGTAPNNIVTLTTNNTTVPRLDLNAGQFNAGTNGTLIMAADGIINGNGGNQYLAGTANDNIIRFTDGQVFNTPELYNITVGGSTPSPTKGIEFVNNARINGIFLINAAGFVRGIKSPRYAVGSYLIYNTGGAYTRNAEWGTNTALAPSYPHHVIIHNGTILDFTGVAVDIGCGGDLTIGNATSSGNGALDISAMGVNDMYIGGNLNVGGNTATGLMTLSSTTGGDVYLNGNWTRKATGWVNFGTGNGRAIFFQGSTDATITASGGQQFPYVFINKAAVGTKVTLADHISISDEITFTRGTTDLGTNNKFLILLSNASKTARVAPSSAANTAFVYGASDQQGQFIVQRYYPDRRSWRLVTAPVNPAGGTHTIAEAWQERGSPYQGLNYIGATNTTTSIGLDTIAASYGTQITGGAASDGFDQAPLNNPSIKYYSAGAWVGPANTNVLSVNSREGWMLFVRGDRKNFGEITNQYKTPTTTTLRPRGQIFIGAKTINSSGMTVVGNPYASAVDYTTMTRTGTGWPAQPTYYMWDPYLGGANGAGAFVTLTWNGSSFVRTVPATGAASPSTIDNRYIPSGAAIMVNFPTGGGTLQINETDKNSANTTTAFRPGKTSQMRTLLNTRETDKTTFVSDGVLTLFSNDYNNDVDVDDARKMYNTAENILVTKDKRYLSIERRQGFAENDTVFYGMYRMQRKNYQLSFQMEDIAIKPGIVAFLEDTYLRTKTSVSTTGNTNVDFSISDDAASAAADRFRLVFKRSTVYNDLNAFVLNSDVAVKWAVADEFNIRQYEVERSTDNKDFSKIGTAVSKGNTTAAVEYSLIDEKPVPGEYYYRVKSVNNDGVVVYSDAVKVKVVRSALELYVFPNPVTDGEIHLQLTSAPAGKYNTRLLSTTGQLLSSQVIMHAGGTATKTIKPTQVLAAGTYQLEVSGPDKKVSVIKVAVNRN
ncbi:MAG: G8 domain-containing protein [Ferruginibacter sp.]